MAAYKMNLETSGSEGLLTIAFGTPSRGDAVVRDATSALAAIDFPGGRLLRVSGPASLPVAMAIAHVAAHRYGAVACFDPKLSGFLVAISHDPDFPVGKILPMEAPDVDV